MPESVPNYLYVDANGQTFAVFPGGITIKAGTDFAFLQPVGQRIQWTRDGSPSGAMVAELYAFDNVGGHTLLETAYLDKATHPARNVATGQYGSAVVNGGVNIAEAMTVITAVDTGYSSVQGLAGGNSKTIIDSQDHSDYARLHAPYRSILVSGGVTGAGAKNFGIGFSVSKVAVGQYQIVWDAAFPSDYAFSFGSDQGTAADFYWLGAKLSAPIVHTLQGGIHADTYFNFIAMWCES